MLYQAQIVLNKISNKILLSYKHVGLSIALNIVMFKKVVYNVLSVMFYKIAIEN